MQLKALIIRQSKVKKRPPLPPFKRSYKTFATDITDKPRLLSSKTASAVLFSWLFCLN
jgi:hypothetical protein